MMWFRRRHIRPILPKDVEAASVPSAEVEAETEKVQLSITAEMLKTAIAAASIREALARDVLIELRKENRQ